MIGRLKGQVLSKQAPDLLLDVQGVGYELLVPLNTFFDIPDIGQVVTLHTHFVVREDAQQLYGCLLYTSPSPRDGLLSRMPSSA